MTLLATLLTLLKIISAILLLKPVLITLSVIAGLILIYNIVVLLLRYLALKKGLLDRFKKDLSFS